MGFDYLQSQSNTQNYHELLLSALDSNNSIARKRALKLMTGIKDLEKLRFILAALLENRNMDTWPQIQENLALVKESEKITGFTHQVFMSLRQGRAIKEEIKSEIDKLMSEINILVSERTILQMTRSSVAKDREWALRKVASGEISIREIRVEAVWSDNV
jgi:hypothetical protein